MLVEKLAHFVKIEKYCDNQWVLSLTNLVINPVHRMFSFSREIIFLQQSLSTGWRKKSQGTVEEIQLETSGFYWRIFLVLITDLSTLNLYVFIQNFRI